MSELPGHVYFAAVAAERMLGEARASFGFETGGILVGRHVRLRGGAVLVVIAASGPGPQAERGHDYFAPDVTALQRELETCRERYATYRVDYVGQWHTHPTDNHTLSYGDLEQIDAILDDPAYTLPAGILTPLVSGDSAVISSIYVPRSSRRPMLLPWSSLDSEIEDMLAYFAIREIR